MFQAVREKNIEKIQELIASGNKINQFDKNTPLHYACASKDVEIVRVLLKNGANPNLKNGNTCLYVACKNSPKYEIIDLLLEYGANPNYLNSQSPLWNICRENADPDLVDLLLTAGADINAKDGKTPLSFVKDEEYKEVFKCYYSFSNDFLELLKRKEETDFTIFAEKEQIPVHKLVLQVRIGSDLEKINNVLLQETNENIHKFLKWIYGGIMESSDREIIRRIAEKMGMDTLNQRQGIGGLMKDLKKLYEDDSSKDFEIFVGDDPIKIHKIILMARSDLYRQMFLNVNDSSNSVHDYTGKSLNTLKTLVKFLYTDQIDQDIDDQVIEELDDALIFYQLNEQSTITWKLDLLAKKKGFKDSNQN
ncbi:ankyrin repeat-containing protein [Anaeramoeba ignava]|uniref:Ankyrin repeat-containing protein n=1 Tax=Anaeramoeba ignava TaxID=1746090 RepID=A0A9Q0LNL0_ANAIG|nr:ankyrin repeat-containing protein [Anaeramoeba ignava]